MERIRSIKNAPRTCDIDIIDFKGQIIENSLIKLPHPRAHERNFVLYPLKDVNKETLFSREFTNDHTHSHLVDRDIYQIWP